MKKMRLNKNQMIFLSLFIFIILWMCFFPLVGDDWGWGKPYDSLFGALEESIDLWKSYNGRVLGHTLVFFMSTYPVGKILIMALTFTLLIYVVTIFGSENKKNLQWILGMLLVLGMPFGIYREVFAWMSGFSNFGIPVLMMSIYLCINRNIFEKKKYTRTVEKDTVFYIIISFMLGFFMNLFSEHSSIFSVILGIGMIIISYIFQKKSLKLHWSFLLGAIIGAGLMFASPSYWTTMAREIGTEMEGLTFIEKILYNAKNSTWFYDISINNILLNAYLTIIFILKIKSINKNKIFIINTIILSLLTLICCPLIVYLNLDIPTFLQVTLVLVMFTSVIINYSVLYYKKNNNFFWKILSLFLLSYIAALPLLAAVGFGPRCFINSYTLLVIDVALIYNQEINNISKKIKIINILLLFAVLILRLFATGINFVACKDREEKIHHLTEKTLVIERLPLWMYVHQSGIPASPYHYDVFKMYYNIDADVQLEIKW